MMAHAGWRKTVDERLARACAAAAMAVVMACAALCFMVWMAAPGLAQTPSAAKDSEEGVAPEAYGGGGGLVVGGIRVEADGKTPDAARMNGWRDAQRKAWPRLWERMSGMPAASAPKMGDDALDQMVRAIEIEREELGATHYVARLAVVFDRGRTASYLGRYSAISTSPPFLLMPVLQDAGTRYGYEPNPWLEAWLRLRPGETPIDYVRIKAGPGDRLVLNAWQAGRHDLVSWQNVVARYQVADVVVPELVLDRSWAGGPLSGVLVVRFGAEGRLLGRLRLTSDDGDVAAFMDRAVQIADRIYVRHLRDGNLVPNADLVADVAPVDIDSGTSLLGGALLAGPEARALTLRALAASDAELSDIIARLKATPGVGSVRITSYAVGGEASIGLVSAVPLRALRPALDAQGLRLDGDLVRRRRTGEPPLVAPVVPADQVIIEDAEVPDEGGLPAEE